MFLFKMLFSDVTMSRCVIRYDYNTIITKIAIIDTISIFFQNGSLDAITPHRPTPTLYRVMRFITLHVTPI